MTGSFSLPAYDLSASNSRVIPEGIWAAATGGGTWVTEVQIIGMGATTADLNVLFYYDGGVRGPFVLTTGLVQYHAVKFSNILQTIDGLDAGVFTYYGKVGAIWIYSANVAHQFVATANTVNGNYGKSFPSQSVFAASTAALGRDMIIPNMIQNATYRTFIGVFNTSSTAITVQFQIKNPVTNTLYGSFNHTIPGTGFYAVNPFTEAGLGAGAYTNTFLYVYVTAGTDANYGLMPFGAIANNTSNDPTALIAVPVELSHRTGT